MSLKLLGDKLRQPRVLELCLKGMRGVSEYLEPKNAYQKGPNKISLIAGFVFAKCGLEWSVPGGGGGSSLWETNLSTGLMCALCPIALPANRSPIGYGKRLS